MSMERMAQTRDSSGGPPSTMMTATSSSSSTRGDYLPLQGFHQTSPLDSIRKGANSFESRLTADGQAISERGTSAAGDTSMSSNPFSALQNVHSQRVCENHIDDRVVDNHNDSLKPAPTTSSRDIPQTIDHWSSSAARFPLDINNNKRHPHQNNDPFFPDVITTQPTLLPRTPDRDPHGLPRFTPARGGSTQQAALSSTTAAAQGAAVSRTATIVSSDSFNFPFIQEPPQLTNTSAAAAAFESSTLLSRNSMGYTTSASAEPASQHSIHWHLPENVFEKMVQQQPQRLLPDGLGPVIAASTTPERRKEPQKEEDDDTTIQSYDSGTVDTTTHAMPPLHVQTFPIQHPAPQQQVLRQAVHPVETPSTVSTAPSTDEASLGDLHFADRMAPPPHAGLATTTNAGREQFQQLQQQQQQANNPQHQRVPSWEASPGHYAYQSDVQHHEQQAAASHHHLQHHFGATSQQQQQQTHHALPPAASHTTDASWAAAASQGLQQPQQTVTSFRGEHPTHDSTNTDLRLGFPPLSPNVEARWHAAQQQQQQRVLAPQIPFLPPGRTTPIVDNRVHRSPATSPPAPYQQLQHQRTKQSPYNSPHHGGHHHHAHHHQSGTAQPPRSSRGQRLPPGSSPHRPGQAASATSPYHGAQSGGGPLGGSNARSSSEILKTLLRKKACLYEPDTSRAVALVTWLVGRELALEYGFFSRQQLQAGVHACVSDKIDSGAITRTKVNRCMQIILNSCFHYIIPRPDGTEENGESFRLAFSLEVGDESFLLGMLPAPWNDITVDRNEIIKASEVESIEMKAQAVGGNRRFGGSSTHSTPQSSPKLSASTPEKNSPGRDSLDGDGNELKRAVLLCFNENVRKAEDVFRCHNEFIRDTAHASHLQLSSQEWHLFFGKDAAAAPYLWGNIGIPVPCSEIHGSSHVDALGMMTTKEAAKFRTSWCTKRYDHDHELCGFAHAEVSGGWLRRDPAVHHYRDEMCPSITTVADKQIGQNLFVINSCPRGLCCEFAHSIEEILYHPRRYKMKACSSSRSGGGCQLGDVCPGFHPAETYRFPKKDSRSSRHSRHAHQTSGATKSGPTQPSASPILYCSPAPISSFEEHLHMPGLQNLFRRQCSVLRAHIHNRGATCNYSYFSDDAGIVPASITKGPFRIKPVVGHQSNHFAR